MPGGTAAGVRLACAAHRAIWGDSEVLTTMCKDSPRHLKEGRRVQWACRMHCAPKSHRLGQGVPYALISERPGHTMGFTAPGKVGASCGYTVAHGDISITQTNRKLKYLSDSQGSCEAGAGPPVHGTSSQKTKGPCVYKRQGE